MNLKELIQELVVQLRGHNALIQIQVDGKYVIKHIGDVNKLVDNWKSHTNLTHPGKYFRPSKVKIMRPTSPK